VRLSLLRYTTATRLDMYSTTHRCVELALSGLVLQKQSLCRRRVTILKKEERAEKGAENKDVPTQMQIARPPPREHRGQRERRARMRPWSPWKLRAGHRLR
jgi:hypothetical protein